MSALRKGLATLLIVGFLYGNLDSMLLIWGTRVERATLPNHSFIENLFYIYGVFSNVQVHSMRFLAYGALERVDQSVPEPRDEWVEIDIYRYFPQPRGEAHRRLKLLSYTNEPERRRQQYAVMAAHVRRLYNRDHPERPVEQVFLYRAHWRIDPRGYAHRYDERRLRPLGHD